MKVKTVTRTHMEPKTVRVLSLGAGVQSSALAFLFEHGKLENPPEFAIFADTQREPQKVYKYLKYLQKEIKSFPIYVTTKGDLGEHPGAIPCFLKSGKDVGMGRRSCTSRFKIKAVHAEIRKMLGYKYRQRWKHHVEMILGISADEENRRRNAQDKWQTNRYPLLDELRLDRAQCLNFIKKLKQPLPARSACYFCPYKKDKEWVEMKRNEPEEWEKACKYDDWLRSEERLASSGYKRLEYLHRSCRPLREVVLKHEKQHPMAFSFDDACDGLMCGL